MTNGLDTRDDGNRQNGPRSGRWLLLAGFALCHTVGCGTGIPQPGSPRVTDPSSTPSLSNPIEAPPDTAAIEAQFEGGLRAACARLEKRTGTTQGAGTKQQTCHPASFDGCSLSGWPHLCGVGVAHDPLRAAASFKLACDRGDDVACVALGHQYLMGWGVAKDWDRAALLYGSDANGATRPHARTLPPS